MRIVHLCCVCWAIALPAIAEEPAQLLDQNSQSAVTTVQSVTTDEGKAAGSSVTVSEPRTDAAAGQNDVQPVRTQDELRDPTVPSPEILERLKQERAPVAVIDTPQGTPQIAIAPLPKIVVKAIVLVDADHGVAMLDCSGRKLIVRLARESLDAAVEHDPNAATGQRLNGFTADGFTFRVAEFSDQSLLLKAGDRSLLVQ